MDDVYSYLYCRYQEKYSHFSFIRSEWIISEAICNHKQIDKILKCFDEDEDESVILECMHSCIGCIGDIVPALEE